MQLSDLRVVVTGAGSGLGKEIALSLCQAGAKVAGVDIDTYSLANLAAEAVDFDGELQTYHANITKENEIVATVQKIGKDLGYINALVNSAGIYRDGLLLRQWPNGELTKMPLAQWKAVHDVDLTGLFLMTREVAFQMVEKSVKPGVIINISSISRHGNTGQANYSAAKAGVVAATRTWAQELAPYGIRAATIAPGFIQTPILKAMAPDVLQDWIVKVPLARLGEPHEIFAGVRFIIECEYFNGKCLDIDGGLNI